MKVLCDQNLLRFDHEAGEWNFDLGGIVRTTHAENAGALMAELLGKQSNERRLLLAQAACIGNQFSIAVLAELYSWWKKRENGLESDAENERLIQSELIASKDSGFILQLTAETFQFAHDHIQLAAYEMLNQQQQQQLHLQIGRSLLQKESTDTNNTSPNTFEIVGHLNRSVLLLETEAEIVQLVQLNLQAANKSKRQSAYETALAFCEYAITILDVSISLSHCIFFLLLMYAF